jgi:hypothetical protein
MISYVSLVLKSLTHNDVDYVRVSKSCVGNIVSGIHRHFKMFVPIPIKMTPSPIDIDSLIYNRYVKLDHLVCIL